MAIIIVFSISMLGVPLIRAIAQSDQVKNVPQQDTIETERDKTNGDSTETVSDSEPVEPARKPSTVKRTFRPSEEISEDKPVPFPVDI